jgi:putative membrane protein
MDSEKKIYTVIGILSAAIIAFLFWLIYFKEGSGTEGQAWVNYLPAVNAFLNTLTSIFLVTGYVFIKNNKRDLHRNTMIIATFTSALFLISYITYHHFVGDTKFVGTGWIRPVYFAILISHILLSIVQVPLILATLYLAATKKFIKHKKIAKITFPIWLYVSVTGVLIFVMLKSFNQAG